jgi:hypothetical protein
MIKNLFLLVSMESPRQLMGPIINHHHSNRLRSQS